MRKNTCEEIRRELDELMLDEAHSASAVEHLKECLACREFHQAQTKLRQMVGGLGTVAAPPDFDFRLRARLANDAGGEVWHSWFFARKGVAFAAVLLVFATGIVVVRNLNQSAVNMAQENPAPVQRESANPIQPQPSNAPASSNPAAVAGVQQVRPQRIRTQRPEPKGSRIKRPLTAVDFASQRAEVLSGSEAVGSGTTAVIPIDASLPSLRFSLDDGTGNPRTIFVPTIRFGSQRMLPNGNQFAAQKGSW